MAFGDSLETLMKMATPAAKELHDKKDDAFMAEVNDLLEAIHQHKDFKAKAADSQATAAKTGDKQTA